MSDTLTQLRQHQRQLLHLILAGVSSTAFLLGVLALFVFTIGPWVELKQQGQALAASAADEIAHIAAAAPRQWRTHVRPIKEALDRLDAGAVHWRILVPGSRSLLEHGDLPAWPSMTVTTEIRGDTASLGSVELVMPFGGFVLRAVLVAGVIATVAAAGFLVLRRRAERLVGVATAAIVSAQAALGERSAELDDTRCALAASERNLAQAMVQISEASDRVAEANRTKSRFLATMSHELRTPLNAIIGFSEIIRDQTFGPIGPARYLEYAKDICAAGQHLLRVIAEILEISKIESHRAEILPSLLDPVAVLDAAARRVRDLAETQGLVLAVEIEEPAPLLWADEQAIGRILLHLLSNAIKFTPSGGRVLLQAAARPDGGAALAVTDTGIGIPEEQFARLVKPFEVGDHGYSRSVGGSGLGLAIAKGLVELHGGHLRIQSALGRGTTVTVDLPPGPTPAGIASRSAYGTAALIGFRQQAVRVARA